MINYIDYKNQEIHISNDNTSLQELAFLLNVKHEYLHTFKIMIDGGTNESTDIGEGSILPYEVG